MENAQLLSKVDQVCQQSSHTVATRGKSLLQSQQSRDVFVRIDSDRILLETDQSRTPIAEIYQEAVLLSGISATDFEQQIKKNCLAFFGEKSLPFF